LWLVLLFGWSLVAQNGMAFVRKTPGSKARFVCFALHARGENDLTKNDTTNDEATPQNRRHHSPLASNKTAAKFERKRKGVAIKQNKIVV
jgi:hypothetical protein